MRQVEKYQKDISIDMQAIIIAQFMGTDVFKKYTHQFCGFILTVRLFGENLCHIQQKSPDTLQWRHNGLDSVSNHKHHHCLLKRLSRCRSKKTSKLRVTGLCAGKTLEIGEFPAQRASNAENVSIWWCHHEYTKNQSLPSDKFLRWTTITFPEGGCVVLGWWVSGLIVEIAPFAMCRICADQIRFCTVAVCKLQSKSKVQPCQSIFDLYFLNSLLGCRVEWFTKRRYIGIQGCHIVPSPRPTLCSWYQQKDTEATWASVGDYHTENTMHFSASWGKICFSVSITWAMWIRPTVSI